MFYTNAANQYKSAITKWLQQTRLLSEAAYRLNSSYKTDNGIAFSEESWQKMKKEEIKTTAFTMNGDDLKQAMEELTLGLWSAQFALLETLWEEYLENLILELGGGKPDLLKPFVDKEYMAELVSDAVSNKFSTIDELRFEAAIRLASVITRQPFEKQWNHLKRLGIGLPDAAKETWFTELDVYFEMRNCIIHRNGRVSESLNTKTKYYKENNYSYVQIHPTHLEYYRWKFLDCIKVIETAINGYFNAQTAQQNV